MTIRDIFEFAESKGQADLPIVVYSDVDDEFYEAKKSAMIPDKDVLKNLILDPVEGERFVLVI